MPPTPRHPPAATANTPRAPGSWARAARTPTAPAWAGLALLVPVLLVGGCSSEQLYATGQNWQRQQCFKLNDAIEREACLRRAGQPQDALERQLEVMKNSH